jgi:predicted transcriptional regulator
MTSQLESLMQQGIELDPDERIELITHLADSLRSSHNHTPELVLTDIQQSQLKQLQAEIDLGLEQVRSGNTVDGEIVFANLKQRIDRYREKK